MQFPHFLRRGVSQSPFLHLFQICTIIHRTHAHSIYPSVRPKAEQCNVKDNNISSVYSMDVIRENNFHAVADWPTVIPGNFPVVPKVMVHHFDSSDYVLGLSGSF